MSAVFGSIPAAVCSASGSLVLTVTPGVMLESLQGYTEASDVLLLTVPISCSSGE